MPGQKPIKPKKKDKELAMEILRCDEESAAQHTSKGLKRASKLNTKIPDSKDENSKKRKIVPGVSSKIKGVSTKEVGVDIPEVATDLEKKYMQDKAKELRQTAFQYTILNRELVIAEMAQFFSPEKYGIEALFSAIVKYCSETDATLWKHLFNSKQSELEEIKKLGSIYSIQFCGKKQDNVSPCKVGRWFSPKFRKEPLKKLLSALLQKLYEAKNSIEAQLDDSDMRKALGEELLRDAAHHQKLSSFSSVWLNQRFTINPKVDGDPLLWPGANVVDIDTDLSVARTSCLLKYRDRKSESEELNIKLKRLRQNTINIENWRRLAEAAEVENLQLKLEYDSVKDKVHKHTLSEAMFTQLETELGPEITAEFIRFLKGNEPKVPSEDKFVSYNQILNKLKNNLYNKNTF